MVISYDKLWKLLEKRKMTRKDLARLSAVSDSTIRNMARGENVNLAVLARICESLHVNLGDIAEFVQA